MRFRDVVTITALGEVEADFLRRLASEVEKTMPLIKCMVSSSSLEIPADTYNPHRVQYNSDAIMRLYRGRFRDRVLMVTQVDLYVPRLNFVFGQAECPGLLSMISLARLDPRFYGEPFEERVFMNRAVKESVHEIGHTYGLGHCLSPRCVMHFSNSIQEVDLKNLKPCDRCYKILTRLMP